MASTEQAASEAARRVRIFLGALLSAESFDQHTLQDLQVISSEPGRVLCSLGVKPQLQNRYGTLHGGAIATLVDVVGSLALITQSSRSGVSLAINTLYLNPMPGGEVVLVDARVIKLGRDVATIEVQLKHGGSGHLAATGTHTKKLVSNSDMSPLFEAELDEQQQQQLGGAVATAAAAAAKPRSRL